MFCYRFMRLLTAAWCSLLLSGCFTTVTASEQQLESVNRVLSEMLGSDETGIPAETLQAAQAIVIIPSMVKAGFIIGARGGSGIMSVRATHARQWSNPLFVTMSGLSMGLQAGAEISDIVLIFKTRRGVTGILNGKFTLGGNVAITLGPLGRSTGAATDEQMYAEIYVYARSQGLFAGVSLEGSGIVLDEAANTSFYGAGISAQDVLGARSTVSSAALQQLINLLNFYAP